MQVEEIEEIIRDLKRYGFTQMRYTNHGMLYGFREFRFSLPNNWDDSGKWPPQKLTKEWEILKAEVSEAYPGIKFKTVQRGGAGDKPKDVDSMKPINNPEDIINVGTAGADSAVSSGTISGSIPVVSTNPEAVAINNPNPTEVAMATKKRKSPTFRDCPVPNCGKSATGKHTSMHKRRGEWKKEYDEVKSGSRKSEKTSKVSKDAPPVDIEFLFDRIRKFVKDVQYERDYYKNEVEKSAGIMANLKNAFESLQPSKVRKHLG